VLARLGLGGGCDESQLAAGEAFAEPRRRIGRRREARPTDERCADQFRRATGAGRRSPHVTATTTTSDPAVRPALLCRVHPAMSPSVRFSTMATGPTRSLWRGTRDRAHPRASYSANRIDPRSSSRRARARRCARLPTVGAGAGARRGRGHPDCAPGDIAATVISTDPALNVPAGSNRDTQPATTRRRPLFFVPVAGRASTAQQPAHRRAARKHAILTPLPGIVVHLIYPPGWTRLVRLADRSFQETACHIRTRPRSDSRRPGRGRARCPGMRSPARFRAVPSVGPLTQVVQTEGDRLTPHDRSGGLIMTAQPRLRFPVRDGQSPCGIMTPRHLGEMYCY
jgi:hypothetical protein